MPGRLFGAVIAGFPWRSNLWVIVWLRNEVCRCSERKTAAATERLRTLLLLFPLGSAGTCTSPTCWSALQRSSGRRWTGRSARFCSSAVWGNPSLWPSTTRWGSCSGSTRTCDASRAATCQVSLTSAAPHLGPAGREVWRL